MMQIDKLIRPTGSRFIGPYGCPGYFVNLHHGTHLILKTGSFPYILKQTAGIATIKNSAASRHRVLCLPGEEGFSLSLLCLVEFHLTHPRFKWSFRNCCEILLDPIRR